MVIEMNNDFQITVAFLSCSRSNCSSLYTACYVVVIESLFNFLIRILFTLKNPSNIQISDIPHKSNLWSNFVNKKVSLPLENTFSFFCFYLFGFLSFIFFIWSLTIHWSFFSLSPTYVHTNKCRVCVWT